MFFLYGYIKHPIFLRFFKNTNFCLLFFIIILDFLSRDPYLLQLAFTTRGPTSTLDDIMVDSQLRMGLY